MSEEKSTLYEFIGRLIADPDFRAALIAAPDKEKAMEEAGYELTEEETEILGGIDLNAVAEELGRPGALPCPCP